MARRTTARKPPTPRPPGALCETCGEQPRLKDRLVCFLCDVTPNRIKPSAPGGESRPSVSLAPPDPPQPTAAPGPRAGDTVLFRIGIDESELRPAIVVRVTPRGCDLRVELLPGEAAGAGARLRSQCYAFDAVAGTGIGEWRAR